MYDGQIGMLVRVHQRSSRVHLRGLVGKITQQYGGASYPAFEVQFGQGQTELFWLHELEDASEAASST